MLAHGRLFSYQTKRSNFMFADGMCSWGEFCRHYPQSTVTNLLTIGAFMRQHVGSIWYAILFSIAQLGYNVKRKRKLSAFCIAAPIFRKWLFMVWYGFTKPFFIL